MKPTPITPWQTATPISYQISQRNETQYHINTTKPQAIKLLIALFNQSPNENPEDSITPTLRHFCNIGKTKTAEYAKHIIDATLNKTLSSPIAAIAMSILTDLAGPFSSPAEFLTERLVGKKRLAFWQKHHETYIVKLDEPQNFHERNDEI